MRSLYLLSLVFLFSIQHVFAGWPIGKGRSVLGLNYNHFYSSKYFDKNWNLKDPTNSKDNYNSDYFSVLFGHGITRNLDVMVNIPYTFESIRQGNISKSRSGLSDALVGLAYSKENYDYTKYFTIQVSAILPLYFNPINEMPLGFGVNGAEITLNYSVTPRFLKTNGYLMFQTSYRRFFQEEGPQQFLAEAGITYIIHRYNQINFRINGTLSQSTNTSFSLSPNGSKDFFYSNANLMYGKRIHRKTSLFLTVGMSLIGRNTGQGFSAGLTANIKLP